MRIWIGGTSGLTQTYINAFPNEISSWILIGRESKPPLSSTQRYHQHQFHYICCDLLTINNSHNNSSMIQNVIDSIKDIIQNKTTYTDGTTSTSTGNYDATTSTGMSTMIDSIVVGIRPLLVSYQSNSNALCNNRRMAQALQQLLNELLDNFVSIRFILHISSIAAIGHISKQHLHSIRDCIYDPSYETLQNSYDYFKRYCEQIIQDIVQQKTTTLTNGNNSTRRQLQYTNLRLGAIYSDNTDCIQCTAWALQMYTGPYLTTKIDGNSSYNVSQLIQLMLQHSFSSSSSSSPSFQFRPVYYYTRCISRYPNPVPYGEYFIAYKKAYHLSWLPILIPNWILEYALVRFLHYIVIFLSMFHITLPYLDSIDYLLQVTLNEHTFDMTETIHDFPNIISLEETIEQCFIRRKQMRA